MKNRTVTFFFFLNIILPGLAQIALGYYLRGLLQLSGAVAGFLTAAFLLMSTMLHNFQIALNDTGSPFEPYNLRAIFIAAAAMILLWLWSLAELPFLWQRKSRQERDETNNEREAS